MHLLDFYRAYPNFHPTLLVKSFYIDIRLGTLTTVTVFPHIVAAATILF